MKNTVSVTETQKQLPDFAEKLKKDAGVEILIAKNKEGEPKK